MAGEVNPGELLRFCREHPHGGGHESVPMDLHGLGTYLSPEDERFLRLVIQRIIAGKPAILILHDAEDVGKDLKYVGVQMDTREMIRNIGKVITRLIERL